jgi:hypothetical protein
MTMSGDRRFSVGQKKSRLKGKKYYEEMTRRYKCNVKSVNNKSEFPNKQKTQNDEIIEGILMNVGNLIFVHLPGKW